MSQLSLQDVADRAGVGPGVVERLIELGVLAPGEDSGFPEEAVRRVRLACTLETAGVPLEAVTTVVSSGGFALIEVAIEQRLASLTDQTFADVSRRTGIPLELLIVIREACGTATPSADDRMREDELLVVPLLEGQLAAGVRPTSAERSLRLVGESLRRVAETQAAWWQSDLVAPMLAAGAGWDEIAAMTSQRSPELSRHNDAALLAIFHAQQAHAWMRNIMEGVELLLERAGTGSRPEREPPAICFLDITGYTRLTEEQGDAAAASLAQQLARIVQRTSSREGGKPVKWLGDGVMFHFPEASRGVVAALDMVAATTQAGLPPAHVGLHAGPVLFQDGDYFGRTVNIASRIAEYARPGEVVVSATVAAHTSRPDVQFREIGEVELKGVAGTHRLQVATRVDQA